MWAIALAAVVASGATAHAEARRIVALAPSVTETLFAVGAGADVVGVSDLSDYPTEARNITRVGSYMRPNVEAVVARRPNLVIAVPSPGNREAVEALEHLGLRVVVVQEGPTLADVLGAIRRIGDVTGRSEQARALGERIVKQVEAVRRRVAGLPPRRTLMIVGENPLIAVGGGNLLDELLTAAGARNVAAELGRWPRLSVEFVASTAPDVIIDSNMGDEVGADLSFYDDLGLAAIKAKRLYSIRIDEVLRPGPRVGEGLEKLARLVHPEAFGAKERRP